MTFFLRIDLMPTVIFYNFAWDVLVAFIVKLNSNKRQTSPAVKNLRASKGCEWLMALSFIVFLEQLWGTHGTRTLAIWMIEMSALMRIFRENEYESRGKVKVRRNSEMDRQYSLVYSKTVYIIFLSWKVCFLKNCPVFRNCLKKIKMYNIEKQ